MTLPIMWNSILYADAVEIVSTNNKKISQKMYLSSGDYPIIDQGNNKIGGFTNDCEKIILCDFPVIVFGDHTRSVKIVREPFATGADGVKVIQPKSFIVASLLRYFTDYLAISIKDKGYARHYQWIAKEKIGIPPINEQHRIVAKIEELFSGLDRGIESLKTARAQLKVYRQALLKHAFEGKLTEQWRADNADSLETADELLVRIKQEREDRYQQQLEEWGVSIEQWEVSGKEGRKPSKPRPLKELSAIETSPRYILSDVPRNWVWEKLGLMTTGVEYGTSAKSKKQGKYPVLRMGNIQNTKFDWSDLVYTDDEKEIDKYLLRKGDVLFNRTNSPELVGKTAIYTENEPALFAGYLIRINQIDSVVVGQYLNLFINSHTAKKHGNTVKTDGVNQSNINGVKLVNYPFPYCSVAEQREILAILDSRLSIVDACLSDIEVNLARADALRQSILKKAFSGQLVPQDPNDEPASILLERIAKEKQEAIAANNSKKKSAKKKRTTRKAS